MTSDALTKQDIDNAVPVNSLEEAAEVLANGECVKYDGEELIIPMDGELCLAIDHLKRLDVRLFALAERKQKYFLTSLNAYSSYHVKQVIYGLKDVHHRELMVQTLNEYLTIYPKKIHYSKHANALVGNKDKHFLPNRLAALLYSEAQNLPDEGYVLTDTPATQEISRWYDKVKSHRDTHLYGIEIMFEWDRSRCTAGLLGHDYNHIMRYPTSDRGDVFNFVKNIPEATEQIDFWLFPNCAFYEVKEYYDTPGSNDRWVRNRYYWVDEYLALPNVIASINEAEQKMLEEQAVRNKYV